MLYLASFFFRLIVLLIPHLVSQYADQGPSHYFPQMVSFLCLWLVACRHVNFLFIYIVLPVPLLALGQTLSKHDRDDLLIDENSDRG